jgi:hypothetical protein
MELVSVIHQCTLTACTVTALSFLYNIVSRGTRWRSWLRHCATNRQVAASIPDGVSGFLHL